MSSSTLYAPLTAGAFLFGDSPGAHTAEAVAQAISQQGAARSALRSVRRLSASSVETVDREIGSVTGRLLDLDLGEILVSSWQKYSKLIESAERTLAAPGSEEIVELVTHRVSSTYTPHVDLAVERTLVHSFEFELELVFDVIGLEAVVREGALAMVRAGECVVTATLTLDGARLAKKRHLVNLDLMVRLDPPRPLISESDPVRTPAADSADSAATPIDSRPSRWPEAVPLRSRGRG